MSHVEIAKLTALVMSIWPQFEVTDERVAAWGLVLGDQDFSDMCEAVLAFARNGERFPPQPGQLIPVARDLANRRREAEKLRPKTEAELLAEVEEEIERYEAGFPRVEGLAPDDLIDRWHGEHRRLLARGAELQQGGQHRRIARAEVDDDWQPEPREPVDFSKPLPGLEPHVRGLLLVEGGQL